MLKKILLGAVGLALIAAVGALLYSNLRSANECDACHRPLHAETYYRIHTADGETMDVCCPRCGLRFQAGRTDVVGAEVTDFETHALLEAEDAFYVEGSPVHFCSHARLEEDRSGTLYEVTYDRCLPSLLAFESRDSAVRFSKLNGGVVKTFAELLEEPVY